MTDSEAKVGKRGQVVIPKRIREEHGIKPGARVRFTVRDGEIIIKPSDELLDEFLEEIPKREEPDDVDWDDLHYGR